MQRFLERHSEKIEGVLHGFDRVLFRGSLLSISYTGGMELFLARRRILYRDYKGFVQQISDRLKDHAKATAQEQKRPYVYLDSPSVSKEEVARRMMNALLERNWPRFLNVLARRVNPWVGSKNPLDLRGYYWTFRQSEYATDVMFRDERSLREIYPALIDHAIRHFDSRDVLRFLGRRTNCRFSGEVTSDTKTRPEGSRIKHRVEENSIKMYDKQGSVLRIETTINNPTRFKVRRPVTRNGQLIRQWVPMRKSVADIARRVDVCRAANERYLEALGVVGTPSPTRHLLDPVTRRITRRGRRYRGLRPLDPAEAELFSVLLNGKFLLQGFRNKDIRRTLFPRHEKDPHSRKQASGRITRTFRLLRAHGLIQKVSGTFYYRVTPKGNHLMTTAMRLRDLDVAALAG